MDINKTIDLFQCGAIDLDCKKMVLAQHKEGGERFEGPGYIRQAPDGALTFKLYVTRSENATPFGHIAARVNAVVGKLHTDDAFYDLEAVGQDGTRWIAIRILPSISWDMTDRGALANGQLQSITTHLDMPQRHHYLRLHFFEEYDVPLHLFSKAERHGSEYMVRDHAEFEASGSKFEVRKHEGSTDTVIEVTSDAIFPTVFHLRIQEALQYITGKTAIWRARLESEEDKLVLELASPRRKSARTQFSPPISPVSIHFHEYGWKLFACYLAYVVAKTEGTHWNPVAYHLYNACEATANSLDAWAVGVSVAVEALASLIEIEDDPAKTERLGLFQKRMREFLAAQADFVDLARRVEISIGNMGRKRAKDTLYALADAGRVEKTYVEAWNYLRNRHVHPTLKDLKKPDSVDYQKLLDHIHRVEVLLQQLTFCLIGYRGPFTDYGADNFPSKQYPLAT
jgi:hypothetical protein